MQRKWTGAMFLALALAGLGAALAVGRKPIETTSRLTFASSLEKLDKAFAWAKGQALAYVFTKDPVGDWYEAALPGREAFCMRDVSHQATGANALGLQAFNRNMLRKFARNISEAKDWCTFWEINRYDRPAPVDYRNDKEFWYNLPANFDLLDAAWRQYLWTGDRTFLDDPAFLNFYVRTVRDYVERWALSPERLMTRPEIMNLAVPLDPKDPYRASRGLASYNEEEPGLNAAADLVAAQYAAFRAYGLICRERGDAAGAAEFAARAAEIKASFHQRWWNRERGRYAVFHYPDGRFGFGIGQEFLLYFGIAAPDRPTLEILEEMRSRSDSYIEMRSYYPEIFFRFDDKTAALAAILFLCDPSTQRREYPEVSFAVIGSLARGLMGIDPDSRDDSVSTLPRLPKEVSWAEMAEIPC